MKDRTVVTRQEWLDARKALLAEEKALVRQRDEICRKRRALPWVKVEEDYVFEGPNGAVPMAALFGGNPQLIVYHFMYAPGWTEGCTGCSFLVDHLDGALRHVPHGGASLAVVSRAPYKDFAPYKARMGWKFPWYSSQGSTFNFDYHVSFTEGSLAQGPAYYNFEELSDKNPGECPGISVFWKDDDGTIYHTYSAYARGPEDVIGAFMLLDMTPLGRNESTIMSWVRRHDEYEQADLAGRAAAQDAAKA